MKTSVPHWINENNLLVIINMSHYLEGTGLNGPARSKGSYSNGHTTVTISHPPTCEGVGAFEVLVYPEQGQPGYNYHWERLVDVMHNPAAYILVSRAGASVENARVPYVGNYQDWCVTTVQMTPEPMALLNWDSGYGIKGNLVEPGYVLCVSMVPAAQGEAKDEKK